jgi:hypothetical protein
MRGTTLSAFIALAAILTGCYMKNPEYPSKWPRITRLSAMETRIEGSFQCSGEVTNSNTGLWTKTSVSDFLIGGKSAPRCECIEIQRKTPEEIEIRFMQSGSEILRKNFKKNQDYHVEDN